VVVTGERHRGIEAEATNIPKASRSRFAGAKWEPSLARTSPSRCATLAVDEDHLLTNLGRADEQTVYDDG